MIYPANHKSFRFHFISSSCLVVYHFLLVMQDLTTTLVLKDLLLTFLAHDNLTWLLRQRIPQCTLQQVLMRDLVQNLHVVVVVKLHRFWTLTRTHRFLYPYPMYLMHFCVLQQAVLLVDVEHCPTFLLAQTITLFLEINCLQMDGSLKII